MWNQAATTCRDSSRCPSQARLRPGQPRAYSLLELLIVVTILGIIALVVIARMPGCTAYNAKSAACLENKAILNKALEEYYFTTGTYATDLSQIKISSKFPDGIPVCPVTGSAYSIDPAKSRIKGHTQNSH